MSVSGNYGAIDNPLRFYQEENKKRDVLLGEQNQEIAANWIKIDDLERIQAENNQILITLAIHSENLGEKQRKLSETIDSLNSQVQHIQKDNRRIYENNEASDKIFKAIAGLVIIGLLATGIVIGVIRYG